MLLMPESGLLFWMILSFGIVFGVLAKFGFPVIVKMVEERKAFIDQAVQSAKEANIQLANIKVDGEAILIAAQKEQVKILADAAETRTRIIAQAKEIARIEASKELEEVKRQIQIEKDEALSDIRRQVAVLSVDIAERVLRVNLDEEHEQMAMIDRLLDEILDAKK